MYYGILDFVSHDKINAAKLTLKNDYMYYYNKYNMQLEKNNAIGELANCTWSNITSSKPQWQRILENPYWKKRKEALETTQK